jgi:hypothetical protein
MKNCLGENYKLCVAACLPACLPADADAEMGKSELHFLIFIISSLALRCSGLHCN